MAVMSFLLLAGLVVLLAQALWNRRQPSNVPIPVPVEVERRR